MLDYRFMQYAFIVSLFIAILSPLIGVFLVLRKYSFIGDTLSHASLAGVSLALASGFNPIWGAFLFTSLAGAAIEMLRTRFKQHSDLVLSIILSFSVGVAITLMSSNAVSANVEAYLFGSLLTVSTTDVITVAFLSVFSTVVLIIRYHHLVYLVVDEETARVAQVKVKTLNYLFSILAAITISVSIKIVGMLVLSSMLTMPVAAALQLKKGFKKTVLYSVIFSIFDIVTALILSYHLNLAPGGLTALISVAVLIITVSAAHIARRRNRKIFQTAKNDIRTPSL